MILDPKDAAELIRQTRSGSTILVGGQAVAFWIGYFGIRPRLPALTVDIDYLGTRREAQIAHGRLRFAHKLKLAAPEDAPNAALLSVSLEGYENPILIDYLTAVIGVDSKEIARSAVSVELEGEPLKLIHPIQLLKSKTWNLYGLDAKRNAEGIEQARLSIEVVAAFFRAAKLRRRETLRAVEAVGKFAATDPARYVRERFHLECLKAIPADLLKAGALPAAFRERRWPQIVAAAK